jgi:hypothetical protein
LDVTKEDFNSFVSLPMWEMYRKFIISEIEIRDSLSTSQILQKNTYSDGLSPLEALGLESAMKLSCVAALDYALSEDDFKAFCFGEDNNDD